MKVKAWLLIILTYIFTFLTPVLAAFFLLADDVYKSESKGGFLFYLILTIVAVVFATYITRVVNKQKANHFKTIFKAGLFYGIMWLMLSLLDYVTFNIERLDLVIYISMVGYFLGALTKSLAVHRYYDYVRELGVF